MKRKYAVAEYVFAFGSNLCPTQMGRRCPGAEPLGRATLPQHRLAFVGYSASWQGGVATPEKATGESLEGALWMIPGSTLRVLDGYEGVPFAYERDRTEVLLDGVPFDAWVYRSLAPWANPPSITYARRILEGARYHGVDMVAIREAVDRARHNYGHSKEVAWKLEERDRWSAKLSQKGLHATAYRMGVLPRTAETPMVGSRNCVQLVYDTDDRWQPENEDVWESGDDSPEAMFEAETRGTFQNPWEAYLAQVRDAERRERKVRRAG